MQRRPSLARSAALAASIGIPALAHAPASLSSSASSGAVGSTAPTSTHAAASPRLADNAPLRRPTPWPLPFVSDVNPDDAEALRPPRPPPVTLGPRVVEPTTPGITRRPLPSDPTVGPATIDDPPAPATATADAGPTASPASESPRIDLPTPLAVAPVDPPSLSAPPGYADVINPIESAEPPGFYPVTDPPAAPTFDPSGLTPPLVAAPPDGAVSVPEPTIAGAALVLTTLLLGRRRREGVRPEADDRSALRH